MTYSTHCVFPHDLFVGKWGGSGNLQEVPRDIHGHYAYCCGPFPVDSPVRRWRQQLLGGNRNAHLRTLPRQSCMILD
jgi:hypothetical protein